MNDKNKAINVNLSSLLSLKAELLRKQHEVKLAKASKTPASEFKPNKPASEKSSSSNSKKESSYKETSRNEDVKVYETEDREQLDKSKRVLEAKSKFYDRMSRNGGSLNSDDNCLVMFNRKRQEQDLTTIQPQQPPTRERLSSSSESAPENDDDDDDDIGDDDDEVEYIDCLGRTRKCLRKELAEVKRRDKQLADSMPERLDQTKANWMIDTKGSRPSEAAHSDEQNDEDDEPSFGPRVSESVFSDALSTMTKHDEQRINWERKEQQNLEKGDVHYQDVFFDEARTHGVGYYAFSTDEAEREQQQRDLEASRKATETEQTRRDEFRAQRDRIVADRVLAAKNRIRARNGQPPISKEEYEREQQLKTAEAAAETELLDQEQRQRQQVVDEAKAVEEAEREAERKQHVRDWDKDKLGLAKSKAKENDDEEAKAEEEWQYKAERLPMSQEQWNEKQRAQRQAEFAPLPESELAPLKRTNFSSMPPPPSLLPRQEFNPFHSSTREKQFQRRSYQPTVEDDHIDESRLGAAIPPTEELSAAHCGPPPAKRTASQSQAELERSIEAGLRFLRDNCDKGVLGNKSSWTAKADY